MPEITDAELAAYQALENAVLHYIAHNGERAWFAQALHMLYVTRKGGFKFDNRS